MKVKIKRVNKNAIIPTYATDGSGAFDFYSTESFSVGLNSRIVGTGWEMEVPEGHVLLLFSRSGHGFNQGIRLANCVGVIDSDYRGEIKVKLVSDEHFKQFEKGDRIAQGLIIPIEQVTFMEADELSSTDRGKGGFGSTG